MGVAIGVKQGCGYRNDMGCGNSAGTNVTRDLLMANKQIQVATVTSYDYAY